MPSEPIAVTLLVIDVFERLGVNYVIGGSLASARHGLVRATMGSDLVADLELEHVHPFVYELKSAFYVDENAARNAVVRQSSFNLIHLETMFKVDIFIPKQRPGGMCWGLSPFRGTDWTKAICGKKRLI